MKSISDETISLKRAFTLFLFKIKKFFLPNSKHVKTIDEKVNNAITYYDKLLKEYQAIKEKKSSLSAKKREEIVKQVDYLISIGHIKVSE